MNCRTGADLTRYQRLSLILICAAAAGVYAQQPPQLTATGWITETMCGAKGANAQHADCARRRVASGKAKYALYDQQTRRLYILEPEATAVAYLGQRVRVTGIVSATPLQRAGQSIDRRTQRVVAHADALDSSTPVAGVLNIASIIPAPLPSR